MRRISIFIYILIFSIISFADKAQLANFLADIKERYSQEDFTRVRIEDVNYHGFIPKGWDYNIEKLAGLKAAMIYNDEAGLDEFLSVINMKIYNDVKSETIFKHYVNAISSNLDDWREEITMFTPEYNMIIGTYKQGTKEVYNLFASMEIAREMFLFIASCEKDRLKNGFYELFAKSFNEVYPLSIYTLDGQISMKYKKNYIREKSREEESTLMSLAVVNQSEQFSIESNTLVDSVVIGGAVMPMGFSLKGVVDGNISEIKKAFKDFNMLEQGERVVDGNTSNYVLFEYKLQDLELVSIQDYIIHNKRYYVIGYTQVITDSEKIKKKMATLLSEIKFED